MQAIEVSPSRPSTMNSVVQYIASSPPASRQAWTMRFSISGEWMSCGFFKR